LPGEFTRTKAVRAILFSFSGQAHILRQSPKDKTMLDALIFFGVMAGVFLLVILFYPPTQGGG